MNADLLTTLFFLGLFLVIVGSSIARCVRYHHRVKKLDAPDAADAPDAPDAPFVAVSSPRHDDDPRRAIARRLLVAISDAEHGFRLCAGCEFTNPRRAALCVICGASLKKRNSLTGLLSGQTGANTLQQRVRNRREWMRGVSSTSGIEWVHHRGQSNEALPSYVLQARLRGRDAIDSIAISIDSPTEKPSQSLAIAAEELQHAIEAISVEITPALEADASCVAYSSAPTGPSAFRHWRDVVTNAWSDFPSKFAQFSTATSSRFLSHFASNAISHVRIRRPTILADSIEAISTMTPKQATAAFRIEFVDEQGIDAGGVYREWCMILYQNIVKPGAGIFVCVNSQNQSFYLNPHSREVLGETHLAYFLAVGRLLGRALMEGNVTGFHLALPLLKIVLGLPVSFHDLQYFDSEIHKNLEWLLKNENVEVLALDFTVTEKLPGGKTRVVELVPGGAAVDVTDANKHEFVDRKLKYLLFESVQDQLFSFLKGVYEIIPLDSLLLFDAEELDYVLSGSDEIDVDDWQRNTDVSPNLLDHPALPHFWKIVRELPTSERRSLLQFATGTTRVPPGGFNVLTSNDGRQCRFSLQGIGIWRSKGCFRSHSCFNRLDVPMFLKLDELRNALLAITSDDSVGFTIE